jgi:hypothetical protein
MSSPRSSQRKPRLQEWLHARARLAPDLLARSPGWVRGVFDHAWAPMQALARQIEPLPAGLWDFLLSCPGGFALIVPGESRYAPGPAAIRDRTVHNVAYLSAADLARDNERPLHVLGHLIDHHLGCGGEPDGPWLSDGAGVTQRWGEAGARLPRLFALGYGVDEIAGANVRDYFAQSLALYCRDRQRLNVADPQIDKWFRSTLWNETFW